MPVTDLDVDRMAAKLLPRERWAVFLVAPAALLRWHRELIARRWTYPKKGSDRRGLDEQVVALVVRLARENPRWGYLRIVGECRNLGVRVSATSVRRILRRHGLGSAPRRGGLTWTQFLRAQATRPGKRAAGHGPLTVETVGLTRPYVLFVVEVQARYAHLVGITRARLPGGVRKNPASGTGKDRVRSGIRRPVTTTQSPRASAVHSGVGSARYGIGRSTGHRVAFQAGTPHWSRRRRPTDAGRKHGGTRIAR